MRRPTRSVGRRLRAVAAVAIGLSASGLLVACEFLYPVNVTEGPDAMGGDARTDAPADATNDLDGAREGAPSDVEAGVAGYNDVEDKKLWSVFPIPGDGVFSGGAFDGRYVYFCPNGGTTVVRLDSKGDPSLSSSFATFDTLGLILLDAGGGGIDGGLEVVDPFDGCVFDGTYLYIVPAPSDTPVIALRYDTKQNFKTESSWESFPIAKLSESAVRDGYGFAGGTYDGRYVYMVPSITTIIARYDTHAAFTGSGAWETMDLGAVVDAGFMDTFYQGAVFDGRYVYVMPGGQVTATIALRYDTTESFSPSSWQFFDTALANDKVGGFGGGAFDGTYVYYVPAGSSVVVRFDSKLSDFTSVAAWSSFDTSLLSGSAGGFFGGAFDGRYVYFVPGEDEDNNPQGLLVRYDTQAKFQAPASWSTFDTRTLNSSTEGFWGAVFDGLDLYLVPYYSRDVAAFKARSTAKMPMLPAFFGSFY
jgi:hypothetical protein